jgi:hypothetical protein
VSESTKPAQTPQPPTASDTGSTGHATGTLPSRPLQKWKGLKALVQDAVDGTSKAVERIQKETANRPFSVLEQVPLVAAPTRAVHLVHDGVVSGVHGAIRWVNRAIGAGVGAALDLAEKARDSEATGGEGPAEDNAKDEEPGSRHSP